MDAALTLHPTPDEIIRALTAIDPTAPPPEADAPEAVRCATLADLSSANDAGRFLGPVGSCAVTSRCFPRK